MLICNCIFITSCSNDDISSNPATTKFDELQFVVHVNNTSIGTRAVSNKNDWTVGDKIIIAIDANDNNLCNLEYKGNGDWSVSKFNEQTNFSNDQGKLSAVHSDSIGMDGDRITTAGDVLYTQDGSYIKHDNVVVIYLNMNQRPVSRIAIVGMDRSCWIDGLEEYSKLYSLSTMKWNTNDSSHGKLNKEIYGDTCVFYGILDQNTEGNTEITLTNTDGATYKRTFSNKIIKAGDYIIIKGPASSEANQWTSHIPVRGIVAVNNNITIMEGAKKSINGLYKLLPSAPTNSKVSTTSSSPNIVRVNEDGTIEALSRGESTITITTDDGGYKCVVNVSVQNIVDFISLQVTGTSIAISPWGTSSSATIMITNRSDDTIHLVTLSGASIDADLADNSNVSYTLSNRFRDITGDNFELIFTYQGKSYSKNLR